MQHDAHKAVPATHAPIPPRSVTPDQAPNLDLASPAVSRIVRLHHAVGNAEVSRRLSERSERITWPQPAPVKPGSVQRFDSAEHRAIGDAAGGNRIVTLGKFHYRISYGELVALAGDYFKSLAQMEALAEVPHGRQALDYARYVKLGPRKTPDDPMGSRERAIDPKRYDSASYDAEVRKQVDDGYFTLAADNAVHFVTPQATEENVEASRRHSSAGHTYRDYHETALRLACWAGKAGKRPDDAHAAEAFAGHFLTDAVSAGHLRTPRLDVMAHWDARDPGLLRRFRAYAIDRVTQAATTGSRTYRWINHVTSVFDWHPVRNEVAESLDAALSGKERLLTMGSIVSKALHDYDSAVGLWTRVGSQRKLVFGDSKLNEGDTKEVAVAAVRAGLAEVDRAYAMGAEGKSFDEVSRSLRAGAAQYEPERLLPVRDPAAENAPPLWAVDTVEELLADSRMAAAMELALKNLISDLESAIEDLDEEKRGFVREGLLRPLQDDPLGELRRILQ